MTSGPISKGRIFGAGGPRVCALLFCVTLAAYFPAVKAGFIWNDSDYVTKPALRSVDGLRRIWFEVGATEQYYPLLHSAFWVEHRLWGDAPMGYHLANILLHATSACLLWLVLSRLLVGRRVPPTPAGASGRTGVGGTRRPTFFCAPVLAAFLFALHPIYVESVAWISEQKNTLSTVFYLLAVLTYLGWREETESRKEEVGRRKYFLATLLFILALLSKTVTATLPGALLVIIWWQRGRLAWKRDVVPLVPWFALGAASGLFSAWVERTYVGAQGSDFNLSALERGLLAGRAVWFYLGKLVWPADLIFIYPRWAVSSAALGQYLYPVAAVALVAALWLMRKRTRGPLAAILFFLGSLFPVCGFFNLYAFIYSYVADHWQYLPSIGIVVLAAAGWEKGKLKVESWKLKGIPPSNFQLSTYNFWRVAPFPIVAILGVLTYRQCGLYRDMETFYQRTLAKNPACWMAENNLGDLFEREGRLDESAAHYEQALRIKPSAKTHYNLGTLRREQHRPEEAIAQFEEALRLAPNFADARNNLGGTLGEVGRPAEAIEQLELAMAIDPHSPGIHSNLGITLGQQGKYDEAIVQFQEALRLDPNYAAVYSNLGVVLRRAGRYPEAIAALQRALQLNADLPMAHVNLGIAFAMQENLDAAVAQFRDALQLDPNYAEAHNDLGNALSHQGHIEEARAQFIEALRLNPNLTDAQINLDQLPPPDSQ